MKRVLSVQDLSCVGRCSLTVAMPVISAMGCQCAVLPTAVLSTHTAFPAPFVRSLTEDMTSICKHWKQIGAEFDVISIGYLSDPAQAEAAAKLTEDFGGFVVLDPVMGDHGALYSRITGEHIRAMSALVRTRAGAYRIETAHAMEDIIAAGPEKAPEMLMSLDSMFAMYPDAAVGEAGEKRCRNGLAPKLKNAPEGKFRLYSESGEFLALCENDGEVRVIKSFYEV